MRLLTPANVLALRRHRYDVVDNSITTRLLTPFWNASLQWMPEHVAPNIITLAGFTLCYLGFYVAYTHPPGAFTSVIVAACVFAYTTLDALDGKQARRTKNATPLGEIFDHLCDSLSLVPITLSFLWCMGFTDPRLLHTVIFTVCCMFLRAHVVAIGRGCLEFGALSGPGEALTAVVLLLCARAVDQWTGADLIAHYVVPFLSGDMSTDGWVVWLLQYGTRGHLLLFAVLAVVLLFFEIASCEYSTRNGLTMCVAFAAYKWLWHMPPTGDAAALLDTFAIGSYFAVLTCESILCKMAKPRPLHPLVVVCQLATVFRFGLADGLHDLVFCGYYLLKLLTQLCNDLSLPMTETIVRVYVDGIYDLTHYAHIKQLEAARQKVGPGQRCYLIVGIPNDEDATSYKRKPVLRMDERVKLLNAIRHVDEIVENAPCNGLTKAFIEQHQIHLVVHGAEYDKPDDPYYKVPREMGITRTVPRTQGISTSDILRRIMTRPDLAAKFLRDTESANDDEVAKKDQ